MSFPIFEHLNRMADFALVVGPCLLWGRRWANRIETTYLAIKDTTRNHLPFIYGRLHTHDRALSLDTPDHPNIVPVNGDIPVTPAKAKS